MKRIFFVFALGLLLPCMQAHADGGVVQLQKDAAPYRITLFSEPSPLRAGPVDLSILLQKEGAAVLDADVTLQLEPEDKTDRPPDWQAPCCSMDEGAEEISRSAILGKGANKLLYSTMVTLPYSGSWKVKITAKQDGNPVSVNGTIFVQKPASSWQAYLSYLLLPLAGIGFFILLQRAKKTRS
ncbi:MAG: hypothetical protein ABI615_00330 [Chthoniobacterales bacterium]